MSKLHSFFAGSLIAIILCTFIISSPVSADPWYAGNGETDSYGTGAYIYTPSSAPYLYPDQLSGESSWVSTAGTSSNQTYNYWMQTGWHYDYGAYAAFSYTEHKTNFGYMLTDYSAQSWGTSRSYLVSYTDGGWGLYIGGQFTIWITSNNTGLPTAPWLTLAEAEVHFSTTNELDTTFSSVCYIDSNGYPNYYDQNSLFADSPYNIYAWDYWYYNTYGP